MFMSKSWRLVVALLTLGLVQIPSSGPVDAAAGVYSFTTAGASGSNGPIQESITAAYLGTTLAGQVTIRTRGIQEWIVPVTDTYTITAAGASGGTVPLKAGGKGRVITSQIRLTQGQVLKILVGQEGGRAGFSAGWAGGGGGGTYIVDSATAAAILVVGGGGGSAQSSNSYSNSAGSTGLDASAYNVTSGVAGTSGGSGGTSGGGGVGNGSWCGGGGGGLTGDGSTSYTYAYGGKSFTNGGVGGAHYVPSAVTNVLGGFGGGGGAIAMDYYETNGGGGGGYSGGGCGRNANTTGGIGGGGGGGNYYTGVYVSNSLNSGNGYATFTRMNLSAASISINTSSTNITTRSSVTISATSNASGRITFFANGKKVPNCISIKTSISGAENLASCTWKPSVRGSASIQAVITPSDVYIAGTSNFLILGVAGRTGNR
jgi:hypothetical protein